MRDRTVRALKPSLDVHRLSADHSKIRDFSAGAGNRPAPEQSGCAFTTRLDENAPTDAEIEAFIITED